MKVTSWMFSSGTVFSTWKMIPSLKAWAEPQRAVRDLALELVEVVPRPPLADAAEPHERERGADDRAQHRETDGDHELRPVERVEARDDGSGLRVRC